MLFWCSLAQVIVATVLRDMPLLLLCGLAGLFAAFMSAPSKP